MKNSTFFVDYRERNKKRRKHSDLTILEIRRQHKAGVPPKETQVEFSINSGAYYQITNHITYKDVT